MHPIIIALTAKPIWTNLPILNNGKNEETNYVSKQSLAPLELHFTNKMLKKLDIENHNFICTQKENIKFL